MNAIIQQFQNELTPAERHAFEARAARAGRLPGAHLKNLLFGEKALSGAAGASAGRGRKLKVKSKVNSKPKSKPAPVKTKTPPLSASVSTPASLSPRRAGFQPSDEARMTSLPVDAHAAGNPEP